MIKGILVKRVDIDRIISFVPEGSFIASPAVIFDRLLDIETG